MKTNIFSVLLFLVFVFPLKSQNLDSLEQDIKAAQIGGETIPYTRDKTDFSSSKTIITAEEILERGYDNLDELLSSVQSLHITHDRTFTQIGIRGISPTEQNNQRVKVLLDGIPLNNPATGQASSGYDLRGIAMEDIEEVIIDRSPSPVASGNNAMLGVIKINTKQAKKGLRLNFDTGSFGELDGGFSLGQALGRTVLGFSGRLATLKGQELYIPGDVSLEREASDFGGFQFKLKHSKFSLGVNYNQRKESIPGVPTDPLLIDTNDIDTTATFYYFRNRTDDPGLFKDRNLFVDLNFSTPVKSNQVIDVHLFFNYTKNEEQVFFRDTETDTIVFDPADIAYIEYDVNQLQESLWAGIAYQHLFMFKPGHQFKIGTELTGLPKTKYKQDATLLRHFDGDDTITSDFWDDVITYFDILRTPFENYDRKFAYWSTAFFVQDFYQINKFLAVNTGLRMEINSQTKPVLAPQLVFLISPFNEKTQINLGYSRSYRLPSLLETEVTQTERALPNSDLVPETSDNYELGLKQKVSDNLDLNVTAYHQALNDVIMGEDNMMQNQMQQTQILQNETASKFKRQYILCYRTGRRAWPEIKKWGQYFFQL